MTSSSSSGGPEVWFDCNPPPTRAEFEFVLGTYPAIDEPTGCSWGETDESAYWNDSGEWTGDVIDGEVSPEQATKLMADMMLDKWARGAMWATTLCKLCHWAKLGGMGGPIAELALRPGLHSSRYSRHIKHVLGLDDDDGKLLHVEVPVSDMSDGSRMTYMLPVLPPHEVLNREISENPSLAKKLEDAVRLDELPPIATNHPVFRASSGTA